MENKRLKLHQKLIDILGSNHVYFQPPENLKLEYPAIVYSLVKVSNIYAGNSVYKHKYTYQISVIDYDPDGQIASKFMEMVLCEHRNHFVSDGLIHDVFYLNS